PRELGSRGGQRRANDLAERLGRTWTAARIRGDHPRPERDAARGARERGARGARRAGCRGHSWGMGALQHAWSRRGRVRRGVPAGVLADNSAPGRIVSSFQFPAFSFQLPVPVSGFGSWDAGLGPDTPIPDPAYFTVSLSMTLFTPIVLWAILSAAVFSAS